MTKFQMIIAAVDKFSKPMKAAKKMLAGLGSAAAGIGKGLAKVALGITAAVAAVSLVVMKYTAMLDKIGKTSTKLGLDPEFLQKMRFAAEQTGVKVEALDMGLQRFSRRIAEAAKGTGEAKQALSDLNIDLFKSDGRLRDVQDVLFDVADAIANTKDSAEQIRLSFKFFDSEGVALVTTLKDGSAGLKEFFEEAENLGILMSGTTIKRSKEFAEATNRIKKQFDALVSGIMSAFLPALEDVSRQFSEWLASSRDAEGTFDGLGRTIRDNLVEAFAILVETIGFVGKAIEDFYNKTTSNLHTLLLPLAILNMDFMRMNEILKEIERSQANIAESDFDVRMNKLADRIRNYNWEGEKATETQEDLNDTVKGFLDLFPGIEKFGDGFAKIFDNAGSKLQDFEKLGENVAKTLEDGLVDAFMNIKSGAEGLKDTMDNIAKQIISQLIRVFVVQRAVAAVGSFFGLPGRSLGGPVSAGRSYIVGEKGPELFTPGRSGGITSNHQLAAVGGGEATNININYDIRAFNAKDATAAIAEQAPTIVGIVEKSFRQRGKRGPLG